MTEAEIKENYKKLNALITEFDRKVNKIRGEREWECICCGNSNKLSTLDLFRSQFYITPSGCNGGDYNVVSNDEAYWYCNSCKEINRTLFHTSFGNDNNAGNVFFREYQSVFKNVYILSSDLRIESTNNTNMSNFYYYSKFCIPKKEWESKPFEPSNQKQEITDALIEPKFNLYEHIEDQYY